MKRYLWLGFFILSGWCWAGEKFDFHDYYWEVTLLLTCQGQYDYPDNPVPCNGDYSFQLRNQSLLERDNGDFTTFQVDGACLKKVWQERAGGLNEVPENIADKIDLQLDLNCVLRNGDTLEFYLGVPAVSVPLSRETVARQPIALPQSKANEMFHRELRYRKGLKKGSNQVEIAEELLANEKEFQRDFKWEYRQLQSGGLQTHQVELQLKIVRHNREKKPETIKQPDSLSY